MACSLFIVWVFSFLNIRFLILLSAHDQFVGWVSGCLCGRWYGDNTRVSEQWYQCVITSLPLNALILFSLIPFHYCLTVDTILPFSLDFDEIRPHIELPLEDDRRVFGQRRQNIPYCRWFLIFNIYGMTIIYTYILPYPYIHCVFEETLTMVWSTRDRSPLLYTR